MEPTARPWTVQVPCSSELTTRNIIAETGEHICKVGHMDYTSGSQASDLANAAHIVHCVNTHDALVDALEVLVEHAQETYPHFESERGQKDIAAALAALAKAKG